MDHEIATLLLLFFIALFNNNFFLFCKFRLLFNEALFFPPEYIGQVTVAFKIFLSRSSYDERNKNTLKATITWPIYSGGKNRASLNKSRDLQNRKKLLLNSVTKNNNSNVTISWATLQSSKSLLNSVKSQVKAAKIANEGITVEYESGLGRSTLDVIQSNSILLNSRIALANSERNYLLAQFNVLKSIGQLNSSHLKLK